MSDEDEDEDATEKSSMSKIQTGGKDKPAAAGGSKLPCILCLLAVVGITAGVAAAIFLTGVEPPDDNNSTDANATKPGGPAGGPAGGPGASMPASASAASVVAGGRAVTEPNFPDGGVDATTEDGDVTLKMRLKAVRARLAKTRLRTGKRGVKTKLRSNRKRGNSVRTTRRLQQPTASIGSVEATWTRRRSTSSGTTVPDTHSNPRSDLGKDENSTGQWTSFTVSSVMDDTMRQARDLNSSTVPSTSLAGASVTPAAEIAMSPSSQGTSNFTAVAEQ